MKISLIHKAALGSIGKVYLLLILFLAGTHLLYGQCPSTLDTSCGNYNVGFPKNETVFVDIALHFNPQIRSQITAAIDQWNTDNENNGSGVYFDYSGVPTGPNAVNTLHIISAGLTNFFDRADTGVIAMFETNRVDEFRNVRDATITFNSNAKNGEYGTVGYKEPYYDPLKEGYDTVFKKKTLHEVGHSLGLCDVRRESQIAGKSVMNTAQLGCANDVCNKQPGYIQECDSKAVSDLLRYAPPPPPFPTPRPSATPHCDPIWNCNGGGGSGFGGLLGGGGIIRTAQCYDVYDPRYFYTGVEGEPGYEETIEYVYVGSYCSY